MNKVYLIGIWWIWVSAVARYYNSLWWKVLWSDKWVSKLVEKLKLEWIDVIIGEDENRITSDIDLVIYSEAVPQTQIELQKAKSFWIKTLNYAESLGELANSKKLIAVSWSHGKSTTSSLISLILKDSNLDFTSVVWTVLKEFDNKNYYNRTTNSTDNNSHYFAIEACEYKRSFLAYKPTVAVITNIDLDHLDYYKDLNDYISAFKCFVDNVKSWWFVILNWNDRNCNKLLWIRKDIQYILAYDDYFIYNNTTFYYPDINLQVPWNHILFDAKLAFIVWHMLWIIDKEIISTLENYTWVWRRSEIVWITQNWNTLMSDYWHHPTEISLTLEAIKKKYFNKKLYVVFQPHQYNRTINLIDQFKNAFNYADTLVIPDIYESRDSLEDKSKLTTKKLVETINHNNIIDWNWLENTLILINDYDKNNPNSSIIMLQWAGNVDNLRYKIIK